MLKNVKVKNFYNDNFLILKVYSLNKNAITSILKKFFLNYFISFKIFKGFVYLMIKINILSFEYEKNKVVDYLKKENFYFNVLGVKNENNFLSYDFFVKNFVYERLLCLKLLILSSYICILNYYVILLKFYFIVNYLFFFAINLFYFRCLHLNKQLQS